MDGNGAPIDRENRLLERAPDIQELEHDEQKKLLRAIKGPSGKADFKAALWKLYGQILKENMQRKALENGDKTMRLEESELLLATRANEALMKYLMEIIIDAEGAKAAEAIQEVTKGIEGARNSMFKILTGRVGVETIEKAKRAMPTNHPELQASINKTASVFSVTYASCIVSAGVLYRALKEGEGDHFEELHVTSEPSLDELDDSEIFRNLRAD